MTPQSSPPKGLDPSRWGQILTPNGWIKPPVLQTWCIDNGVFAQNFSEQRFWDLLESNMDHVDSCVFVTAPDVVANSVATLDAFRYWGPRIKAMGWTVAFVAQDGQENLPFPPGELWDAIFIGGSTEWKMSKAALFCIDYAKRLEKWVHVGRVNSMKRIKHFKLSGVDSVDGTTVVFAPDKKYPIIDRALCCRPLWSNL